MNNILGSIATAMVIDKNEKNLFVQKDGLTIKVVDKDPKMFDLGDMVEGFVYINQKDEYVMMTEEPQIQNGVYGLGEVVAVQHDLGVFVDVGWIGKDLVVSLDDLPLLKNVWPRKGDMLLITPIVDDKDRMWGKLADVNYYVETAKAASEDMHNTDVTGRIVSALKAGSYVQLEDGYVGFIHPSERDEEPRLGKEVNGRVVGLRDDNILYVSLMPRAHEALDDDAAMILEILKRTEEHRIPYHDKSDPEEIRTYFGISKGQFKRAVGRLMKNNLAKQDKEGTFMTEEAIEREL